MLMSLFLCFCVGSRGRQRPRKVFLSKNNSSCIVEVQSILCSVGFCFRRGSLKKAPEINSPTSVGSPVCLEPRATELLWRLEVVVSP